MVNLLNGLKAASRRFLGVVESAQNIETDAIAYGYDGVTVSMLLGSGKNPARSRATIYEKYHLMMGDPIISTALRAHVTQALGGHETSGDTIFLEPKKDVSGALKKQVEEIARALLPLLNRDAHTIAFKAAGFGDSYARLISKKGVGVTEMYTGDMILPPLVQPYERGNTTTGYLVTASTKKISERFTVKQMARCKMARMGWVPQVKAQEIAQVIALAKDNVEEWPHVPSLVGGSFLEAAETPYDRLSTSLLGLVSNRILGSIDESLMTVNMSGMSLENRNMLMASLGNLLKASKERTRKLIEEGKFSTERITHVLPVDNEKQLTQVQSFQGSAGSSTISIEDVMLQAKLLAGALGIDLALLGFADQLAGGLGEGGFFRTSVQAAERSEIIRTALTEFIHHVVDVHCFDRYGYVFDPSDRPYAINFYGATSALEREQQESRERATNSTALLVQIMQQIRELGLPRKTVVQLFATSMQYDNDYAETLAEGIENAKPPEPPGGQGGFGGGFGDDETDPDALEVDANDAPGADEEDDEK
ncbi:MULTISPECIES: hypothetical protein [Pseudomonas]|uniref:Portal protein n=1 Tax=Pseudomonas lutea TaxID=243924 RepID=A0A9X8MH29_9PSED|nr:MULTISPECIES: hypothetical protein [Pseudomonas]SER36088.1 hypothetical protein SAMN05216409_11837 [Pseudomonas lutea]